MEQGDTNFSNATPEHDKAKAGKGKYSKNGKNGKSGKNDLNEKYGLKKWVFRTILIVIAMGIIFPYAVQVICTIWFDDYLKGIETWNQFVGIILGVVATILSIVSMIMSFKNYEDTLALQETYTNSVNTANNIFSQTSKMLDQLEKLQTRFDSVFANRPQSDETTTAKVLPGDWKNKGPEES